MMLRGRSLAVALFLALGALRPGGAQEALEGANLIDNASFEDHGYLRRNRSRVFPSIPGWGSLQDRVELHDGQSAGIRAVDGNTKLGLDTGINTSVFQDLTLVPGARYRLQLFHAPERDRHDTGDMEVLWGGDPVARLSGGPRYWRRHVFDLAAPRADMRLLLRGVGRADGRGALVDALGLSRTPHATGNLVFNGSFEAPVEFGRRSRRVFGHIPGWDAAAGAIELRRHDGGSPSAYEAATVLSLDGRYGDTVEQTVTLDSGRRHDLELGFAPRRASGDDRVEVWLGDRRLVVLEGTRREWHRRRIIVEAPDAAPATLSLRAPPRLHGGHHPGHGHGHDDDDDDDDHHHGHDHDHHGGRNDGGLVDDVRLYGACWASDNLLVNPSFEEHPSLGSDDRGVFSAIPGWRAASGHLEIHRYGFRGRSLLAAEGRDHLELGANGQVQVVQDVATEPGAPYLLEFAYSPRVEIPGTDRNDVQVWWDGAVVATASGDRKGWQFLSIPVRASSTLTELRFAGINARAGLGGQIDEVRLMRLADLDIVSDPIAEAAPATPYSYVVALAEEAVGARRFELVTAPEGMLIDPDTGRISWDVPVAGTHRVIVAVRDGCGRGDEQAYDLVVGGSNRAPVIVSAPGTRTPLFHLRPAIVVSDDNPGSESVRLNGAPYVSGTAISADGAYTLEVEAVDAAGNSASRSVQFSIDREAAP